MNGIVSIVTRQWAERLRRHGLIFRSSKKFVLPLKCLDSLLGLSCLLFSGFQRPHSQK